MVRVAIFYSKGSVNLFQKEDPHELVGKGQGRKGPGPLGSFLYSLAQAKAPANDKDQVSALHFPLTYFFGQLQRIHHLSLDSQDHNLVPVLNML